MIAAVIIVLMLVITPFVLKATLKVIGRKYPQSKVGAWYNEWEAKRALNKQQKHLRAIQSGKANIT